MTDPISDYLTRIRNAQQAGHRFVEIPASKLKKRITELLYDKGYILKYKFEDKILSFLCAMKSSNFQFPEII